MATSTQTATPTTSTTIQALAKVGEMLGLQVAELQAFIKDQQDREREERALQREHDDRNRAKEKEERELQREREDREHERRKEERMRQDHEKARELEFKRLEAEQRQKEQEMQLRQLELQLEMRKIEVQAGLEEASNKFQGDAAADLDEGQKEDQPGVYAPRSAYFPDVRL